MKESKAERESGSSEAAAIWRRPSGRFTLQKSRHLIVWLGLLPLLLGFAAYRTSKDHFESVGAALATDNFLAQLNELLSTLKDAETGQRGYLLTGEGRYLMPYRAALSTIGRQMAQVTRLAPANGVRRPVIDRLRFLVSEKMGELQYTIDLRDGAGLPEALDEVKTGRGEAAMVQARAIVNQIQTEQKATLQARLEAQRRSQQALESLLAVGVGAGLLLLIFAYRFSSDYARERDETDRAMQRAAENLELRVEERTAQLAAKTHELEKLTGELQRSNQDLLQFAYIASHDLQEPIRTVGSYVSLLARRYGSQLDDTAKKYIQFAVDGASRMQTLINDLLNYSRAGTQKLETKTVPANDILERALKNLRSLIQETGAVIRSSALPTVEVDETKMLQVFQNLLANAIKFRKEDAAPEVTVQATKESDMWVFAVSDNGIGFDEKYTDRIFEVFQRLHGLGKYPGNGIGLAICRRIVEHHGGRMWAHSAPEAGSTFFFSVPAWRRDDVEHSGLREAKRPTIPERIVHV
jgi:signal transduction histidine kinase